MPNNREQVKDGPKISNDLIEFVADLKGKIRKDENNRYRWKQKLVIATNQRLGIKRNTNKPYPGAPNIPLPETDKNIRKKKPMFVLSVTGQAKPVSVDFGKSVEQITPDLQAKRIKSELGINFVLTKQLDLVNQLAIAADFAMEKGIALFKIVEEFKEASVTHIIDTESFTPDLIEAFKNMPEEQKIMVIMDRYQLENEDEAKDVVERLMAGEKRVVFQTMVISSMPKIIIPNPEDVIVPAYTNEISNAERITHQYYMTARELKDRVLDESFNKKNVEKAIENKRTSSPNDSNNENIITLQKDQNEGISTDGYGELFRVHETLCWRPTGPKGKYERWVFVTLADVGTPEESILQVIRFPYDFDTWNWEKHDNELKDHRYYSSRGIPEQIQAMQEFMERAMNNALIRDEINNNPVFTRLSSSKIKANTNRFIPGQVLTVSDHNEISEVGNRLSRVDLSSQQIWTSLKAFIEEYMGSNDQLFRNATNAGGGKTLGEIELGVQLNQNMLSLEVLLWNETLKNVFKKVWAILKDRVGKPLNVGIGPDGNPIFVTRDDFDFDAEINLTGSLETMNKAQMLQKALVRVNMIMQQLQVGLIVNADDLYNVMRDYLEEDGVRNPDRYITRPEIIQEQKMKIMQQQTAMIDRQDAILAEEEKRLKNQQRTEQ